MVLLGVDHAYLFDRFFRIMGHLLEVLQMSPTPDQMGHFLVDDPENEIFSPIFDFGKRGNGQLDRIESKLDRILNILEPIETEFRLQRLGLHPVKDANIINTFRSSYLFTFKEKK